MPERPENPPDVAEFYRRRDAWLQEEKLNPKRRLGMTAEDHLLLGGTPPPILAANPGKTEAELMTDEEIEHYLMRRALTLSQLRKEGPLSMHGEWVLQQFRGDIAYLTRTDRLPNRFKRRKDRKAK